MFRVVPKAITTLQPHEHGADDDDDDDDDDGDDDDQESDHAPVTPVTSDVADDNVFTVERILAERVGDDGTVFYLVYWQDYPVEESTWEVRENILAPNIMNRWNRRRLRELAGSRRPFDVAALESGKLRGEYSRARKQQKQKQKSVQMPSIPQKRPRPSLDSEPESSSHSDLDSVSSSSSSGVPGVPLVQKRSQPQRRPSLPSPGNDPASSDIASTAPPDPPEQSQFTTAQPSPRTFNIRGQGILKHGDQGELKIRGQAAARGRSVSRRGKTALRGGSSLMTNVFLLAETSAQPKKKRDLITVASDTARDPKFFSSIRIRRKAELQGRNRLEGTPDISQIPGGLFDPSKPLAPISPAEIKRNSIHTSLEAEESPDLFVQNDYEPPAPPQTIGVAKTEFEPVPHLSMTNFTSHACTCYFWHKENIGEGQGCRRGEECPWHHSYMEGRPIADPPPGYKEPARSSRRPPATCFFWYRYYLGEADQPCIKGADCPYSHFHDDDMTIADPPPGYSSQPHSSAYEQESPTGPPPWRLDSPPRPSIPLVDPQTIAIRPQWDPNSPLNAICYYWAQNGHCSHGDKCKYYHSNDIRIPVAPSPREQRAIKQGNSQELCKFWARRQHCKFGRTCNFVHESPSSGTSGGTTSSRPSLNVDTAFVAQNANYLSETPMQMSPQTSMSTNSVQPAIFTEPDEEMDYSPPPPPKIPPPPPPPPPSPPPPSLSALPKPAETSLMKPQSSVPSKPTEKSWSICSPVESTISNVDTNTVIPHSPKLDFLSPTDIKEEMRSKKVVFGPEADQTLSLDFGDMSACLESPWLKELSSTSSLIFDHMCMGKDFGVQQAAFVERSLWQGSLRPADDQDIKGVRMLEKVVEELSLRSAGLIHAFLGFSILIYPAKKEEWKLLDIHLKNSPEGRLNCFIFQSPPNIKLALDQRRLQIRDTRPPVLARIHDLDYNRLIDTVIEKQNGAAAISFYLLFPPGKTAQFITKWLRDASPDAKIYTSQTPGSWHYVSENLTGVVVLVHQSLAREIYRLPSHSKTISKSFAYWFISDSTTPWPAFPSNEYTPKPVGAPISATRLFPASTAILITPSFIVAEPEAAYEFLEWFLGEKTPKYLVSPGWRLVCPHNFREYLFDLALDKSWEWDQFELKDRDAPYHAAEGQAKGLTYLICEKRFKMHSLLVRLDALGLLGEEEDEDNEEDCPLEYAPGCVEQDDEVKLVQWFAGWSMGNLDRFRRFVVLGSMDVPGAYLTVKRKPEGKGEGGVEEKKKEEVVTYTPTMKWYAEAKSKGEGWEHIMVMEYNGVKKFLGIK